MQKTGIFQYIKPESFPRVLADTRVGKERWIRVALSDVQGVKHQYMMVILRKSNHVTLTGNLEPAAS